MNQQKWDDAHDLPDDDSPEYCQECVEELSGDEVDVCQACIDFLLSQIK